MSFGAAKSFWHIPVHEIARSFGPSKSIVIPMFHAYTGSGEDVTGIFWGNPNVIHSVFMLRLNHGMEATVLR